MATLRSVIRKMAILSSPPPPHATIIVMVVKFRLRVPIRLEMHIPYPPNFKSTPARTIDPATGASTWALGSHKWPK